MAQTCPPNESRITPGTEAPLAWSLTFHDLACIIAILSTIIAVIVSLYNIWAHALNYTHSREQRFIIRILFLVPIYSISAYLQVQFYWRATYFKIISDCYEAFAIASFFALLCAYVAPLLDSQKAFFRDMRPIKPWAPPISLLAKCFGGQSGPFGTPESGLTWFGVIWTGIYQYCFVRVVMMIAAVTAHSFDRFCDDSLRFVFAHVWYIIINTLSVNVAIFCLAQFFVQLRGALAEHKIFIKIVAVKLVVFLPFLQLAALSIMTSTFIRPGKHVALPDLKVGIQAVLLCIEMAIFSVLNLWAFPYAPYVSGAPTTMYPSPDPSRGLPVRINERHAPSGGFMGLRAIWDAINIWDVVKDFELGMKFLFHGKHRKQNANEEPEPIESIDMVTFSGRKTGAQPHNTVKQQASMSTIGGLIDHAQTNPEASSPFHGGPSSPAFYPSRRGDESEPTKSTFI